MKIILSRKGFDGSFGGVPSPIRNGKRYFVGSRSRGYFQAANRGQEFIVDQVDARTLQWLANLLRCRNPN